MRDADGEFCKPDGGFPSTLDRHLIDYCKPGRSLSKASDTVAIAHYLPGAKWVGYSEAPFFAELQRLQGDPLGHVSGERNGELRDALFAKQTEIFHPVISPGVLTFTQPRVNRAAIEHLVEEGLLDPEEHPAYVVYYGSYLYVVDGHHRLVAAHVAGHERWGAKILRLKWAR